MKRAAIILIVLFGLVGAGCAASRSYRSADSFYFRGEPEVIEEAYAEAWNDGGINALLGIEKLLSAAVLRQDWRLAEQLALRASTMVNLFVADAGAERDALSLFGREKSKPFKGEPHEQAMADFYLGLLRYQRGDHEGALAAFRSAMYKDRGQFLLPVEVEEAEHDSDNVTQYIYNDDYATMKFMASTCYSLLGEQDEAERMLEQAQAIAPELADFFGRGFDPSNNVIVVLEAGRAPRKIKSGPDGVILDYVPGRRARVESVLLDGKPLDLAQTDDLYYQATTVGGRMVDELNEVKAKKGEAIHLAGFAMSTAGYWMLAAGNDHTNTGRQVQLAGFSALLVGIATMAFADIAIDPSADTRAWNLLPGQIFIGLGRMPPGNARLEIRARGEDGADESQAWSDVPVTSQKNLFWIRLLPSRRGGTWRPVDRDSQGSPGPGLQGEGSSSREAPRDMEQPLQSRQEDGSLPHGEENQTRYVPPPWRTR